MKWAVSWLLLLVSLALAGCRHGYDLSRSTSQVDFGVEAAKMNLWREALFRFQRAVELNPQDAMARNNLAVAYEGIGEFDKARIAYLEALRLDKSNEFIQKNYSRFTEFVAKNKKRERKPATTEKTPPSPAATNAPMAPPKPPAVSPPGKPEPAVPAKPSPSPPTPKPSSGGAL